MSWFLAAYRKGWLKTVYPLRDVPPLVMLLVHNEKGEPMEVVCERLQPYLPHQLDFKKYKYQLLSFEEGGRALSEKAVMDRLLANDRLAHRKRAEALEAKSREVRSFLESNPVVPFKEDTPLADWSDYEYDSQFNLVSTRPRERTGWSLD